MFFLDRTSLSNFSGFAREFRLGTQNQAPILMEGGVIESTTSVGVTVTQSGGPITRTVTNLNIDRVAITVQVPTFRLLKAMVILLDIL